MAKSPAFHEPDAGAPDVVPPTNLAPAIAPGTPLTVTPPPPECTRLPPSVTLVIVVPPLLRRASTSFPDPWMTAPMLLTAVHGAVPACAFVRACAVVGSAAPMSPTTRVAPGATFTQ